MSVSMMEHARTAVRGLLDLALPTICVSCERQLSPRDRHLVCMGCWARLAALPAPRCDRCGHPTYGRGCKFCELLPPFVRAVRSVCWVPHEVGSAVVSALKYHGWEAVAAGMAERMARLPWPADVVRERAAFVPVPLARSREKERGFNQAWLLAVALGEQCAVPAWNNLISRERSTGTQTKLTPGERSANVHSAFAVPAAAKERVRGRHLVLVDDVITTGATLNACADVLFAAGARTISYVTFGRARASGDR